jgi:hypothetical protein
MGYGGGSSDVQQLMNASCTARDEEIRRRQDEEEAKRRALEERARQAEKDHRAAAALAANQQKLAAAQERIAAEQRQRAEEAIAAQRRQRRWTITALATAGIAIVAAIYAGVQSYRADQAVIETKASSLWSRLQLWGDPLQPKDVATLWDLNQQDERVRVAFVRQLATSPDLLARFGFKPQPIARAVGLQWPVEGREIVARSASYVASDQFDPKKAQPFEILSYTRALAAVAPLLDAATRESGTRKIAGAINDLAGTQQPTDQQLWALAELVGAFAEPFGPEAIEPARERLQGIIWSAEPSGGAGWRGQAISRAIEVMAPQLDPAERLRAIRYLMPLLGQNTDSWSAKAIPRAMVALLPRLDTGQAAEMLSAVPRAIATSASVAVNSNDSSYLLSLMQVVEKSASMDDRTAAAALGQALVKQFAAANEPLQSVALVRATIPLLPRLPVGPTVINRRIANIIFFVPGSAALDPNQALDPVQSSRLRESKLNEAAEALSQAASSPDEKQKQRQSEEVLDRLLADWNAEPSREVRSIPSYRLAAQARLLAVLAPSLTQPSAAQVTEKLLPILPSTQDYLTREAIARALAALAPNLPEAERGATLAAAQTALKKTGSSEEATAWAHAIAALLPKDPRAATAVIVEALKSPTATGTPSTILLAALAKPWPEEYEAIADRTLPDPIVEDWLEEHLPKGYKLSDPPTPPDLQAAAGPGGPG